MTARAALIEVFHSIQGEGRFVGVPMAFVRVATCPIRCRYCDTPHSYSAGRTFRVAVHGTPRDEVNPVDAARTAALVAEVAAVSPYRAARGPLRVSITGGEPLVYPQFVAELGAALGPDTLVHLETAALDAAALRVVLPVVAHVSADYKLPETLVVGDHREAHVACIAACVEHAPHATVDVKLVLTADHTTASFERALADLRAFAAHVLVVLQPVTPFGASSAALPRTVLEDRVERTAAAGFDFVVVPQTHKQLGVE